MIVWNLLLASALLAAPVCNWCVFGQAGITEDVVRIASLSPFEALRAVRQHSICVKVMDTHRRVPPDTFAWAQIESPSLEMRQVSQLTGLMGKTLCAGEIPLVGKCPTIILASDAPFSTLIHEYLHFLQIGRDPTWCGFSKSLIGRGPDEKALGRMSDMEWDVHLFLWNNYKKMDLALDDQIAIVSETVSLAQQRRNYDPDAKRFLAIENPAETLDRLIADYRKKMGIKK